MRLRRLSAQVLHHHTQVNLAKVLNAALMAAAVGLSGPAAAESVPDSYIVVFKSHAALDRLAELPLAGSAIQQVFAQTFPGLSVRMPAYVAELLAANPLVKSVEPDQVLRLQDTQINPPWGLDRIDKPNPAYDARYNYRSKGAGVHVYIVDSGLRRTHREFAGRVGNGFDAVGNGGVGGGGLIGIGRSGSGGGLLGFGRSQPSTPTNANDPMDPSSNPDDCNGHGTHVGGTVAGTTFGVAKQAILHGVRVVNCQGVGTSSSTIAGLEWIMKNHVRPAVVNMSLGGGTSDALDQAIRSATEAGITVVVAAGNDNTDACTVSPAREPAAITVAATQRDDRRASYSNFGRCVDLFAPGTDVVSAGIRSDSDQTSKSGTSMASPHVAGAVAKLLSEGVRPTDIPGALLGRAAAGVVINENGSPDRMLFSD